MIRVSGIKLTVEDEEREGILKALVKRLGIREVDVLEFKIFRKSIDARKNKLFFVYSVDAEVKNERRVLEKNKGVDIEQTPDMSYHGVPFGQEKMEKRPVVVGTGPAGLFAALILSEMGFRPMVFERGGDVQSRTRDVKQFWETGVLNPESNVQFGEGGAGTFSDGKLTTLIRDRRCRKVLEELVAAGAPEEILYLNKPHVGTDILKKVVINLRERIIKLGGEVKFYSRVSDIHIEAGRVLGVVVNEREEIDASVVVLAVGHSARDIFRTLFDKGVLMVPKAFSLGVRVEHPQHLINRSQYKGFAGHEKLGPADYKLVYHDRAGRSCYTFCMCPGGVVVAAASESGGVVTNGMSYFARDAENANSALLVGVTPEDFGSPHPLAGIDFQRIWEKKAFDLGGGGFTAPVQLVGDFLQNRPSSAMGSVKPSYPLGVTPTDLRLCLPSFVAETIRRALPELDKKLRGFCHPEAVLTGVETRSSSPLRINRDDEYQSSVMGLYPSGEGAGYAGGIISSAVDGIRVAEAIVSKYRP